MANYVGWAKEETRNNAGNPADFPADSDVDHSFEVGHVTISQMSPSVKEGALMTSRRVHFTFIFARLIVHSRKHFKSKVTAFSFLLLTNPGFRFRTNSFDHREWEIEKTKKKKKTPSPKPNKTRSYNAWNSLDYKKYSLFMSNVNRLFEGRWRTPALFTIAWPADVS